MHPHTLGILNLSDWALFRNATYSVAQALNYIENENDKGVLVKETAIAITVIKSKIYKII